MGNHDSYSDFHLSGGSTIAGTNLRHSFQDRAISLKTRQQKSTIQMRSSAAVCSHHWLIPLRLLIPLRRCLPFEEDSDVTRELLPERSSSAYTRTNCRIRL
jgi:hypothetical protein